MNDAAVDLTGRKLAFGAAASAANTVGKVVLQLAMVPLMAHFLGPAEYGLYALALPSVSFFQMLADGGLGNSLAREPESSEIVWSTAFWLLHGVCGLLAAAIIAWSFVLATLANQPRLPAIMSVLGLSLLLVAASVLPTARLIRRAEMAIGGLTELGSNIVGAAVGLFLAMNYAGVWCLVAQYLTSFAIRAVILNIAAPSLPKFEFRISALAGHLSVGASMAGSRLSDFLGRLVENTMVSRSLGASLLGVYSFGNQVPRFVCESVTNPAWFTLYVQALHRGQSDIIQNYYRITLGLSILLLPSTAIIASATPELISLLLGPSWQAATPLIVIMLPSYALSTISSLSSALLYAAGLSRISFWCTLAFAILRVVALTASIPWGLEVMAAAIGIVNLLFALINICVPAKAIGSNPLLIIRQLTSSVLAAAAGAFVCNVLISGNQLKLWWILCSMFISAIISFAMMIFIERKKINEYRPYLLRLVQQISRGHIKPKNE